MKVLLPDPDMPVTSITISFELRSSAKSKTQLPNNDGEDHFNGDVSWPKLFRVDCVAFIIAAVVRGCFL